MELDEMPAQAHLIPLIPHTFLTLPFTDSNHGPTHPHTLQTNQQIQQIFDQGRAEALSWAEEAGFVRSKERGWRNESKVADLEPKGGALDNPTTMVNEGRRR